MLAGGLEDLLAAEEGGAAFGFLELGELFGEVGGGVEADGANERGRRFAVVSGEVRSLAHRSAQAVAAFRLNRQPPAVAVRCLVAVHSAHRPQAANLGSP